MDIVLTGTGSPLPDADRAGPSTLIKAGDTHILVDAGRGVVMRMAAAGSLPGFLSAVLITHLHSDHVCALNDVVTTHWVMTQGRAALRIHGPVGTAQFVSRQMAALEADIGYRIAHHDVLTDGPRVDVVELEPGTRFRVGNVAVATAATEHSPARPTLLTTLLLAIALAASFVTPAAAQDGPTLTVDPTTMAAPGDQEFTVTGAGYTQAVFVLPCIVVEDLSALLALNATGGDCDVDSLTPATPDAEGNFSVTVTYTVPAEGLGIVAGSADQSEAAFANVSIDKAAVAAMEAEAEAAAKAEAEAAAETEAAEAAETAAAEAAAAAETAAADDADDDGSSAGTVVLVIAIAAAAVVVGTIALRRRRNATES